RGCNPELSEQIRPADAPRATIHLCLDAMAGQCSKVLRSGHGKLALHRARQDCARHRMLRVALHGRSNPQSFVLIQLIGYDLDDAMLAERERARLVEDDRVQIPRLLETAPVADEQAATRTERRRDRNHERNRESECVRACDYVHGYDALYGEARRRTRAAPGQGD